MKQFGLLIVNIVKAPAQVKGKSSMLPILVIAAIVAIAMLVGSLRAFAPTFVAANAAMENAIAFVWWIAIALLGLGLAVGLPVYGYCQMRRSQAEAITVATFRTGIAPALPTQRRARALPPKTVYVASSIGTTEMREISR